ncbi:MAG: hypothetical protein GY845_28780 [Planctomycetes bacterium]|nr:hypothetical protein [Planctomycetota bacterium]
MLSRKKPSSDSSSLATELYCEQFLRNPNATVPENKGKKLRYWQGQFYLWRDGRFYEVPNEEMEVIITRFLMSKEIRIEDNLYRSIKRVLAKLGFIQSDIMPNSWLENINGAKLIVAKNGNISLVDFDDYGRPKLLPHTPLFFTFSKLPYNYDPTAEYPQWMKFLDEIMSSDKERIRFLQQWTAYVLFTEDLKEQKFLICVGEGANGKTVFSKILEMLVGRENCSHLQLAQLGYDFALECTIGKKLISINEGGRKLGESAEMMLKTYTSGDEITVQRKYRSAINFIPTAKVMICTNTLPHFADKSQGVWRRMIYIPFDKTFSEGDQNKNLVSELAEELPGIFNWAYDGLASLQENGFLIPAQCREAIKQYKREENPARSFLEDNFIYNFKFIGYPSKDLYKAYQEWCLDNGHHRLNSSNFGKEVKRVYPKSRKVRPRSSKDRKWYYSGLEAESESEIKEYLHSEIGAVI